MTTKTRVIEYRPITDALISMLETAMHPHPIGDDGIPDDANVRTGYLMVSLQWGRLTGPPLWAPSAEAELNYQIDVVGSLRSHAEWLADRVRLTMLSLDGAEYQVPFPHPPGWKVIHRQAESDGTLPGVISEGVAPNRVHTIPGRFRLDVVAIDYPTPPPPPPG